MVKINECLFVGVDFTENRDVSIMAIGRQTGGQIEIINIFQGKEAEEFYNKLTFKKEE